MRFVGIAGLVCFSTLMHAQQPTPAPNFYTDVTEESTPEPAKPTPTKTPVPTRTPAPTKTPTATKTPAPTATRAATPAKPATPAPTAAPRAAARRTTPQSTPRAQATPRAAGTARSVSTTTRPKFPQDPFGLAAASSQRWDFTTVLPTVQEELAYRARAARLTADRLARTLSEFTAAIDRKRQNADTAASITYLLARARVGSPGFAGPDVTFAHLAAARATLREDGGIANTVLDNYQPVRETLNAALERANLLDQAATRGHPLPGEQIAEPWQITVGNAELATQRTSRMLQEKVPPLDALVAILQAEAFARELHQRETLNSLAPPPPAPEMEYRPYVDPNTPLPELTQNPNPRQPQEPRQPAPEPKGMELVALEPGAPVRAVADGTVVHARVLRGYGNLVILQHGSDLFSVYGYLEEVAVSEQQRVSAGTPLARAGSLPLSTRPGIYFDVRRGADSVPPETLIPSAEPQTAVFR